MRLLPLALLLGTLGCSEPSPSSEMPTPREGEAAGLSLHLHAARLEPMENGTFVHCDVRWENETGAPLEGDTCCGGGAFDGLSVVLLDAEGRELARQSHLYHQSPVAEAIPFTLPPGTTHETLVFPVDDFPEGVAQVRIEGGLLGNDEHREGYASEARRSR